MGTIFIDVLMNPLENLHQVFPQRIRIIATHMKANSISTRLDSLLICSFEEDDLNIQQRKQKKKNKQTQLFLTRAPALLSAKSIDEKRKNKHFICVFYMCTFLLELKYMQTCFRCVSFDCI